MSGEPVPQGRPNPHSLNVPSSPLLPTEARCVHPFISAELEQENLTGRP